MKERGRGVGRWVWKLENTSIQISWRSFDLSLEL